MSQLPSCLAQQRTQVTIWIMFTVVVSLSFECCEGWSIGAAAQIQRHNDLRQKFVVQLASVLRSSLHSVNQPRYHCV